MFHPVNVHVFAAWQRIARDDMPAADALQVSAPDDAEGSRYYLTSDGSAGFGISASGELVNLFKAPGSTHTDIMTKALRRAKALGATYLHAFDTYLVEAYKRRGAVESLRTAFDDNYAPTGWDVRTMGRPDYVTLSI